MTTETGGLPLRTTIILLAAAAAAIATGVLTYRETGKLGGALLMAGTTLVGTTAYLDWLLQSPTNPAQ